MAEPDPLRILVVEDDPTFAARLTETILPRLKIRFPEELVIREKTWLSGKKVYRNS